MKDIGSKFATLNNQNSDDFEQSDCAQKALLILKLIDATSLVTRPPPDKTKTPRVKILIVKCW